MEAIAQKPVYRFLQGGGEMAELTRQFDWASTPVGEPSQWPQSLRTTVGNLLRSRFPMFLWWGEDMIQFYNDAYRPSLGNDGKHPWALGAKGKDCWPEIWDIISPLHRQVEKTGEATWMEDQLVPIYRNGKIEDVYWTYSYSSVLDDEGKHAGILVTCTETTSQVVTLNKLQNSEQRFQNLVREATVGIVVLIGEDMVVEIANDAYGQLIDRKASELIGKPLFDIIPETKPHFHPVIEKVRVSGESLYLYDYPFFYISAGVKKEGYLNLVYQPYKEQDGNITGVMVLTQDVTEQVQARKKIEEADERARLSIEAGALGTFDVNLLTNEVITSPQFDALFNVDPSRKHKDIIGAILPEDLKVREKAHKRALQDGILEYEARVRWKDGSIHWIQAKGKVFFDDEKKPIKLLGVAHDITEEKAFAEELERQVTNRTKELIEAQQSLLNANIYLQNIINLFKEPLQVLEPVFKNEEIVDFRYKLTNAAYAAYANTTPENLEGKKVGAFFPGYFQTTSFTNVVKTFKTGLPDNWEIHYNVDGLNIYNNMSTSIMDNEVVVHFTDFTKLKNLQLDLERKVEELQRSNKNLEEFAYAASHDLKEPIRKIHFFSDRLKSTLQPRLTDDEKRSFERMETAARRMSSLIDDLLSYSQVSFFPRTFDEVNLDNLISIILSDLDIDIEEKKATIEVGKLCTVKGNQRQLQQAFQNLIVNALKYSKSGQPPEINISCKKINGTETQIHLPAEQQFKDFWLITIQDNGIGFEQKEAERIFNVFTRLHGNSEFKGTGIGLSIVRKVIENHNGFITAQGEPGQGAAFFIYLPIE